VIYLHLRDRWKLWRWRRAGCIVSERSCRRCGYAVRALASATCPECGADRNITGTIAPLPPLWNDWRLQATAWVMALFVFACVFEPLLYQCMPRQLTYYEDCYLRPRSGLYGPIALRRRGITLGWPYVGPWARSVDSAEAFAMPDSAFFSFIEVSPHPLGTQTSTHARLGARFYDNLTADSLLDWLRHLKIDVMDSQVRAEATELATFLNDDRFGEPAYADLQNFSGKVAYGYIVGDVHDRLAWWLRPIFWGLIAAAGIVAIIRRRPDPNAAQLHPVS
jgi:hypothetical protein